MKYIPETFDPVFARWKAGEINSQRAADELHMHINTFYKWAKRTLNSAGWERETQERALRDSAAIRRHQWQRSMLSIQLLTLMGRADESQVALAQAIGESRQTVNNWVCARSYPNVDKLRKIAAHYGISISELTGENHD